MRFRGFRDHGQTVQKHVYLALCQSRREAVFGQSTDRLVLDDERHAQDQRHAPRRYGQQQRGRRAGWAAHGRDDDIRIEHQSHIFYNVISQAILPERGRGLTGRSARRFF
jgi:hypothetical protein